MKTVRDLVEEAYIASEVLGEGMGLNGDQLKIGLRVANIILLEEFVEGIKMSTEAIPISFNGSSHYTIGTGTVELAGIDTSPDFLVTVIPESIDSIIIIPSSNNRYTCNNTNAQTYYSRPNDLNTTNTPEWFYFERQAYSVGFPTINFIGNPTGSGEIISTPSNTDLLASTLLSNVPKTIIPYLLHEMTYRIAMRNEIDGTYHKSLANKAHIRFVASSTPQEQYTINSSYLGFNDTQNSFDYNRGKQQIAGGR